MPLFPVSRVEEVVVGETSEKAESSQDLEVRVFSQKGMVK